MNFLKAGEKIQIHSYKHDGTLHRIWEETTVLKGTHNLIIGANDKTLVTEADGRTWVTREPSICYFDIQHWYNVIGMLRPDGICYYCNIGSPFIVEDRALKYIDYDLDVRVNSDMTYTILDEDEYEEHRISMNYPKELDGILRKNIQVLIQNIQQRKGPFATGFVDMWYERFLLYRD